MNYKQLYKNGALRICRWNVYATWNAALCTISSPESHTLVMRWRIIKHSLLLLVTWNKAHLYEVEHYIYMPRFKRGALPLLAWRY